jgi:hypothetical protein
MRPLLAHCHLGLGTLYRRSSDLAKGDESLGVAAMYHEMSMNWWLEKGQGR